MGIRIGIVKSEIWCKVWLFGKTKTPCNHLVYKALMMFGSPGAEREANEPLSVSRASIGFQSFIFFDARLTLYQKTSTAFQS